MTTVSSGATRSVRCRTRLGFLEKMRAMEVSCRAVSLREARDIGRTADRLVKVRALRTTMSA
jgi:hypothetical protein